MNTRLKRILIYNAFGIPVGFAIGTLAAGIADTIEAGTLERVCIILAAIVVLVVVLRKIWGQVDKHVEE